LTANPINPITRNPTPTALEISINSAIVSLSKSAHKRAAGGHAFSAWLRTSVQEECAIFDKVAGDVEQLFQLVGHFDGMMMLDNEKKRRG